jgi:electron-transferring-flavoprotein dehydrogenase
MPRLTPIAGRQHDELSAYPEAFEKSWLYTGVEQVPQLKT